MRLVLDAFAWATAGYTTAYHLLTLLMLVVAVLEVRRQRRVPAATVLGVARQSGTLPRVSVLIPAFNEEHAIVATVRSALALDYPDFEVVVVSDGSTDATTSRLWDAFDLAPSNEPVFDRIPTQAVRSLFESRSNTRLKVVDKRNGGKADALNAAINCATGDLVLALDADVVLDRDALVHLAIPFLEDERTVATSGMIRPLNGCALEAGRVSWIDLPPTWLERFQVLEYLRSYGIGRQFFNPTSSHLIISGAFGLFRRDVLTEIGGYQPHAVGEDMELVVRIHRHLRNRGRGYRIAFSSDALCLTDVPHSLKDLGRQRTRWHLGLLGTLRLHRGMAFRRRYGAVGLLAFPFFLVELFAPVAEAAGWVVLPALYAAGLLPLDRFVPFLAASILLGSGVSFAAVLFDATVFRFFPRLGQRLLLVIAGAVEHFGYRQLTVWFRLRAFWRYYTTLQLGTGWRSPSRLPAARSAEAEASAGPGSLR
jgi:cellulose synthase/poly-beta-1,6-N-acetylglucosamine synthase-like glycosyltransferase